MSSPVSNYVRGIHEKFDFYAAWPPTQPRKLGDVGRLVDGQFERLTTLEKLGVEFTERVGNPGSDMAHTSGSNVAVQIKAQGETLPGTSIPNAKAGAIFEFSASGAFVFQAAAPVVREIEDQVGLAATIIDLFRNQDKMGKRAWDEKWCVVTQLISTENVTVLISTSQSSKVELGVEGALPVGPAQLASVSGGLNILAQKGEVTSVLAAAGLTPLFRVARVRRSILDRLLGSDSTADVVRAGKTSGTAAAPKRILEPVPLDDALGAAPAKATPATTKVPAKAKAPDATGALAKKEAPTKPRGTAPTGNAPKAKSKRKAAVEGNTTGSRRPRR